MPTAKTNEIAISFYTSKINRLILTDYSKVCFQTMVDAHLTKWKFADFYQEAVLGSVSISSVE